MKPAAVLIAVLSIASLAGCTDANTDPLSADADPGVPSCELSWFEVFAESQPLMNTGDAGSVAYPLVHNATMTRFASWTEGHVAARNVDILVTDAAGATLFSYSFGGIYVAASPGAINLRSADGPATVAGDIVLTWETDGPVEELHVTMEAMACLVVEGASAD